MKNIRKPIIFLCLLWSIVTIQAQNLALNKPVTVSSTESAGMPGSSAVDGNMGTRWSSAFSDPQWIYVDLGNTYTINQVKITWETAMARDYQIQVSANASTWTNIKTVTGNATLVNDNTGLNGSGRYVRIYGTARATGWGYSIFELEVYSTPVVRVTGVSVVPATASINVGATTTLTATIAPSNATNKSVSWASSNTSVATVNSSGQVTGVASGTATITVTTADGGFRATSTITVGATTNIARNKPVTVSSTENAGTPGTAANDGNASTRWSSAYSDPQWIMIDLQASYSISRVVLNWETAAARSYQIQVSDNGSSNWTTIYSTSSGAAGVATLNVSGNGRYIRMYGTARTTGWGYSLWEFEVYGTTGPVIPVTGVNVSPTSVTLSKNTSRQLTATVAPADATNKTVSWTTNNASVATVSETGLVTAINDGTANITVTTQDGNRTALCSVTVSSGTGTNLALNRTCTASSVIAGNLANYATDGNINTRWESTQGVDPQWIYVDLGSTRTIKRVKITWEAASASAFQVQTSNDASNWTTLRTVTANTSLLNDITGLNGSGRYVRIYGTARTTGYGYSIYELEVYDTDPAPVTVPLNIPYAQFLRIGLNPADLNNRTEITTQNTQQVVNLSYLPGTQVTLSLIEKRDNDDPLFWTLNPSNPNDTLKGVPLTVTVYQGMQLNVKWIPVVNTDKKPPVANAGPDLTVNLPTTCTNINGSLSSDPDGTITRYQWSQVSGPNTAALTNATTNILTACGLIQGIYSFRLTVTDNDNLTGSDDVTVTVQTDVYDFLARTPANNAMVTNTRRPTFTWDAVAGSTNYQVWVNITRTDYDWRASGNLLDRYTKVADVSTNSYTMTSDLNDRWTYKWYVVSTGSGGTKYSNKQQFSVYLPTLETVNDGINIVNGCRDMNKNGSIEPYEDWRNTIEVRLNDLMSRMTLEEKFRQCFYGGEVNPLEGFSFSYGVEGGMTTTQQAASKTRMGIPVAFLGDKIHGWKTIYPTQLGLAATRDMNLVHQCGDLQRREQKSFGFTGTLMPLAEVNTKVLYPRFQEGCGENADEAAAMVRAIVCGLQGGPEINPHSILITVKHWPGQGAGGEGPTQYDANTIKYHMKPWYAAVEANAASIMPGYSSSPLLDPTGAGSNSSQPIINYLRNTIGFKGFIVTDWLAATTDNSAASIGAGIDVMGGAPSSGTDMNQLISRIGQQRLEEAARRVLETKLRLGMFENPYGDPTATWTSAENHQIVLNAARKSITLVKNNGVLPLKVNSGENMIVGGPRATWINNDYDPNVIWQSIYYNDPQAVNYVKAFQNRGALKGVNVYQNDAGNAKAAIVVIGEQNYTHGTEWAEKNPVIPADQLAVIQGYKNRGIPVVTVVLTPRPYVLTDVAAISDAILLVYRGGTAIAQATAELCFGDFAPSGKLPFQMPRSTAQIGTDDINNQIEKWDLPYDLGATDAQRSQIRNYIANNQPVPTTFGDPLYPYGWGLQSWSELKNAETDNLNNPGISEQKPGLVLYPNPAESLIYLSGSALDGQLSYQIVNISGQVIQTGNIGTDFTIGIEMLKPGYYVFKLNSSSGITARSFMKK
ncbi:MAG: discoidin domain-containing protein [Bacteroidales bacterium]|nr:discoidin domain-containing protein [Bacteroidales bacterium]